VANEKTKIMGVPVSSGVVVLFAMFGAALLVWLAKDLFTTVNRLRDVTQTLENKITKLESDEAKWAMMAQMRDEITQLQVDFEILRRVFEYEYNRHVPIDEPNHKPEIKINKEDLQEFLDERRIEADEMRRMMEQMVRPPRSKK